MADDERDFRLSEEFFTTMRRASLTRALPTSLLAGAAGLLIASGQAEMSRGVILVASSILTAVICGSSWRSYRQQVDRFRRLRISLSAAGVGRSQPGLAEIFIPAGQIRRVVAVPGKSLTIYGPTPQLVVAIPETIEGFDRIREAVEGWCPAEVSARSSLASRMQSIAVLAMLIAFVIVFKSDNAAFVTAIGLPLIAFLGWSALVVRASPHVDARMKSGILIVILPILGIALRILSMWQR